MLMKAGAGTTCLVLAGSGQSPPVLLLLWWAEQTFTAGGRGGGVPGRPESAGQNPALVLLGTTSWTPSEPQRHQHQQLQVHRSHTGCVTSP